MSYQKITEIKVGLNFGDALLPVGRLAMRAGKIYFEYDAVFLARQLKISPLHLPLQAGVKTFDPFLFDGLPGVFNDSLPDGWGRLLLDRAVRLQGILPAELTPLDRLAHVGNSGMGALIYEPDHSEANSNAPINLDKLASHADEILSGESGEILQELLALNGSSAGARPKAMIGLNLTQKHIIHGTQDLPEPYEHWLVKFPSTQDGNDAGAIEYVYALMAKDAGLIVSDAHLFPARHGAGYFATQRFDRPKQEGHLHAHTVCGLLHSDFRTPSLDYEDLLALTEVVTKDFREVEKMYRQAVFNVLAHNRDDHAKNFSFLMNKQGEWKLSPAYDLTFSSGPGGEQSMMVLGEGKNPTTTHLLKLGEKIKLNCKLIAEIIEQTQRALSQWSKLAKEHGVNIDNIKLIDKLINK